MKNMWKKTIAIVLSCIMIIGAASSYAAYAEKSEDLKDEVNSVVSSISTAKEETDTYQEETVFVISSNDGSVEKLIVNDKYRDHVAGTETFTQSESNSETPVDIKISYSLDGVEMTASEIAGKSGHVVITYSYTNKEARTVDINGSSETIYVPFAVATGMLLDNEKFTNVTVQGGRVAGDGNRLAVVGIAFPGLKESLGIDADSTLSEVEIPDSLVVEADVTDFSLKNSYSFVTNYDLGSMNLDAEDSEGTISSLVQVVTSTMDKLVDGSTQLYEGLVTATDGASQLADGSKTAYEGSQQLNEGAETAYNGSVKLDEGADSAYAGAKKLDEGADAAYAGAKQLADGADSAYSGATQLADGADSAYSGAKQLAEGAKTAQNGAAQLDAGMGQLVEGLNTLTDNNAALTGGAKQVFDTLLATADQSLAAAGLEVPALTINNYSTVIDGAVAQLSATDAEAVAKAKVVAQVNANRSAVEAAVTEAVKAQVTETVLGTLGLDSAKYEAAKQAGMISAEQQTQIEGAIAMQMGSDTVKAAIASNTDAQCEQLVKQYMASDDVKAQIAEGKKTIESGIASLNGLKASLDSYNTFYQGILTYTEGVSSAAAGAGQLSAGASSLNNGLKDLSSGADSLETGLGTLADGTKSLKTGLGTLADGSKSLKTGLGTLADGTESLKTGLGTLADGTESLKTGLGTLADGTSSLESGLKELSSGNADLYDGLVQLRDGSETLKDGLQQINDELVAKIVEFIDNDAAQMVDRLNALAEISGDYKSVNGLSGAEDGAVKFIYKLGEVK